MPSFEVAPIPANAAIASGVTPASAPPTTQASTFAALDHPHSRADRLRAGGARRDGAVALAPQAVADCDRARGGVGHHLRHAQRRHRASPALAEDRVLFLDRRDPADPGTDTQPMRVESNGGSSSHPACAIASSAGDDRELREAVGPAGLAAAHVIGWLEVAAAPERRPRSRSHPRPTVSSWSRLRPRAGSPRRAR